MINIKEEWDFHSIEPILGIEIGDVNNNGQNEIIALSKSGKLLIVSLSGKKITESEISENSSIWKAKICDIDHDSQNEVVLGGLDGFLRTFKYNSSYELHPFWTHQFGASISGFLCADVNIDGNKEIIAYSIDKSIRCLNSLDGSLVWGQIFEAGIGDAIVWQDPLEPNLKEVIAAGNDGTIRIFEGTNGDLSWFKRYNDKIRCVSLFTSKGKELIVCGGDDKILHFIEKKSHDEIKSFQFNDFVWKCASFTLGKKTYLLVSTYSFAFFDDSVEIEDNKFSSKIICLNSDLEINWEIENINLECFLQINFFFNDYLIIGTTKGNILILEAGSGNLIANINKNSCVNDIKYNSEANMLISCHDSGSIFAYFLGKA
jgi:WD40 repeat protein